MARLENCKVIYHRETIEKDTENIYIFIDNLDRSSGNALLSDKNSDYYKKYHAASDKPLKYPTLSTSAVIRGLNNAFPITIKRRNWGKTCWGESNFQEFKMVIDEDIRTIKRAIDILKPKVVYFPLYGLLGSTASVGISLMKTPRLFNYIIKKEKELLEYEPNNENY